MGNRIKELREKRGLKQEILAIEVGASQQTISRIEKDKYKAPTDLLINIAQYFNVTVDYLLELTDIKRNYERQIKVDQKLDEYYDLIMEYEELDKSNQKTMLYLLKRLKEAQDEVI